MTISDLLFKEAVISEFYIHNKEIWVIVSAVQKWHTELLSTCFTVYTDYKNLTYFWKKQWLNKWQLQWADELKQYNC